MFDQELQQMILRPDQNVGCLSIMRKIKMAISHLILKIEHWDFGRREGVQFCQSEVLFSRAG